VVIPLDPTLPSGSSDLPAPENDANNVSEPIRSCTGWGLHSSRHYGRDWWSLTPPFHPCLNRRYTFCCTFHIPTSKKPGLLPLGGILFYGARTFLSEPLLTHVSRQFRVTTQPTQIFK